MENQHRVAVLARRTSAKIVAMAFMPGERAAEDAVMNGAECIRVMIEERKKAKLAPHIGADELVLVASAVTKAADAFRDFASAHAALIKIPDQNGMDSEFGPSCPPNTGHLRNVPIDDDRKVA